MLDIARLERIRLSARPLGQRVVGNVFLAPNYHLPRRVDIQFEGLERLPREPVIIAMNHTDRYNYFPFQYRLWRLRDELTATWVKGKYYENSLLGKFMEWTNNLPTVSRGYLISRDFLAVAGRPPNQEEYAMLRRWVDAAFTGGDVEQPDQAECLPADLLSKPRNILGQPFEPAKEDYPGYMNSLFAKMMSRFVELNRLALETGLHLLVFPQGTRSIRLSRGHIGLAEMALHLKTSIVPVGCNGSDLVHPGASPFSKGGQIVYRFGEPISYQEMAPFHTDRSFTPFTHAAESTYNDHFQGLVDLVIQRIDTLLDPAYQLSENQESEGVKASERFI